MIRPLLLALLLCAGSAALGEPVTRVFPVSPEDGAVSGSRPVFHIGYVGDADLDPGDSPLRITLTPRDHDAEGRAYVFDGRRRRNGWLVGDDHQVVYRAPKPVRDGAYRWTVEAWNGVDWAPAGSAFDLRIDSVPPADVTGLRLSTDTQGIVLEWDPVTLDREGRPEYVARYHVYRYRKRPFPAGAEVNRIGVAENPRFLDAATTPDQAKILYYRVVAEDLAGNQPGRRE